MPPGEEPLEIAGARDIFPDRMPFLSSNQQLLLFLFFVVFIIFDLLVTVHALTGAALAVQHDPCCGENLLDIVGYH